jgi:FkbM family methyltransferase
VSRRGKLLRDAFRLNFSVAKSAAGTVRARILDYEVEAYSRSALLTLFDEIFVNAQYLFRTDVERPVVIDCGSNIGMSILFFKALYPGARVTGFEPSKTAFTLLKSNVVTNTMTDVEIHESPVGETDGRVDCFVDPQTPGSLTMSTLPERAPSGHTSVEQVRLSRFINEPVDFLKLDVEGAESRVLQDLVSSGKIHLIKQMGIEYHHHIHPEIDALASFLSLLESSGFGYQIASSSGLALQASQPGEFQDLMLHAYRKQ